MFLEKILKPKTKPFGDRDVDYLLLYMVTAPAQAAFPYFISELADEMEFAIRHSMSDRIKEVGTLIKIMEATLKVLNDKGVKFEPDDGLPNWDNENEQARMHQFIKYIDDMWGFLLPLYDTILHERKNRKV